LDVEYFEKLCRRSVSEVNANFKKALSLYQKALDLYNGDYLEETDSAEWVWSVRNKYRELLISTILELKKYADKKEYIVQLWQTFNQVQHLESFDERLIESSIKLLTQTSHINNPFAP